MRKIELTTKDREIAKNVELAILAAISEADMPPAVAKRIASVATRQRNKGRAAAMKRHPFKGVCEATGRPLDELDKVLDELEPEKGYYGKVRWICPKCNNSGNRSC